MPEASADASRRERQGDATPPDGAYLRLAADFDNYRKRTERDREAGRARLASDLMRPFLQVRDSLALAAEHADGDLASGLGGILGQCDAALQSVGGEPFGVAGEAFDPALHRAVGLAAGGADTVVEVRRQGWRCGPQVVRSAEVVVGQGE